MQRAEELLPIVQIQTRSNTVPVYALPHETASICPECNRTIPALVFERDEKIWLTKTCPDHGICEELYFGSARMFKKFAKTFHDGKGIDNPNVPLSKCNCPKNCGLCSSHLSHSGLTNLVITNRCDLTCWYCFFYAKKGVEGAYVYEPTQEQIRQMIKTLRAERPVPGNSIQITGGEPTLRSDLVKIVQIIKEEGVDHIQLNTNLINLAIDPALVKQLRDAGVSSAYASFDGVTPRTNGKNHWEAPYAIENCRKAGLNVVLVPTVIKSVNDHEVGGILRFGQANMDIVRAVNYQPVSLTGRLTKTEREKYRITIPDVISRIEQQTDGEVTEDDWFSVPTCVPMTHFIEAFTKQPKYELSIHFACGAGTYVFKDSSTNKLVPLTRFVDLDGLLGYMQEKADELNNGASKLIVVPKILAKLSSFIDNKKAPNGLNLSRLLFNALVKHDYSSIGDIHNKAMFLGMMHFQDKYNHDEERLMRCDIHYVTPDQRIIPFCAFNVVPEWYRDRIQQKFAIPIEEWERNSGHTLEQGLYRGTMRKGKQHHSGCGCSVVMQQTQQARNMETITGDVLPIISS
ncbi:MAG: radical SAM protein [Thaumarchaeota archaeon]|nr:radical SAM protein [Nitrososphaerota archaeon]